MEEQPRDLIRYVFAPRDVDGQPEFTIQDDMANPVQRSIKIVNYLSDWVATLVLVQTQRKNRARLFEKFILVASHLRDLENFDALMGVLAGLNSQPVHRLDADYENLKTRSSYKKFRSLNRLMASDKGYAAYRMALASSNAERIPYLGCHLQDLTRFSEGKTDS